MKTNNPKILVALAGNANVGKSVIFNHLTKLHQHIGNWPGKTIERAVGSVYYKGYEIKIIDLPGIYSLSTFSSEELISRDHILTKKPDIILNVLDGSILERNLFFTLQLMELNVPMIVVINQMDMAKDKGITINFNHLESLLGVPVIPSVATKGVGLSEILRNIFEIYEGRKKAIPKLMNYGQELETQIARIQQALELNNLLPSYPQRWLALKVLEQDEEVLKDIILAQKEEFHNTNKKHEHAEKNSDFLAFSESLITSLEELHGHSCGSLITSEKYGIINCFIQQVQEIQDKIVPSLRERLDSILLHPIIGYFFLFSFLFIILYSVFFFGDTVSGILLDIFEDLKPSFSNVFGIGIPTELFWACLEGLMGGISIALPYILPFYLILGILEDSGYMTRLAFMMDRFMHLIGLHGKAFIPCMLGIGCNVPACLSCRIMEHQRDRMLTAFITTLIPCTAQSIIILALVGKYVGFQWVIFIYLLDIFVILILGRIASKILPGEPMGLIMEMVSLNKPNVKIVLKQTFFRLKEFVYIALPLIVIGSLFLKILEVFELLGILNAILSPITVGLLGLPEVIGVALIFGIVRKELAVILLGTLFGTMDLISVMNPVQMIVFSIVTMLYIPCLATIAALKKELKWKRTLIIVGFEIAFAFFMGGIISRILPFFI